MLQIFSYATFAFFFLLVSSPVFPARTPPNPPTELTANDTWQNFVRFVDAGRGSRVTGISELKKYFQRFGYLDAEPETNLTDTFDDTLESAVVAYQKNLGLSVTGELDSSTIAEIMSPRCGVGDVGRSSRVTGRYAYFHGEPRWSRSTPMTLTYAFSPTGKIDYVPQSEIKEVFERSFSRWSAVIPVGFKEVEDYRSADIRIGFFRGAHGDLEAFDGVLGILGHAFAPENGRFHLDAAERWAVDFRSEKSKVAVDLESVATHEIGHILGLAHSSVKDSIMYPNLSPRTRKVDLRKDDVAGVQALYGSNPNFKSGSLSVTEASLSWAVRLETISWVMIIWTSALCL